MPIFSEETFLESLNTCCELDSISELSGFVYNKCHLTLHVTSKAQKWIYFYSKFPRGIWWKELRAVHLMRWFLVYTWKGVFIRCWRTVVDEVDEWMKWACSQYSGETSLELYGTPQEVNMSTGQVVFRVAKAVEVSHRTQMELWGTDYILEVIGEKGKFA